MMWKKPKDVKYVDMCIWIDSVIPRLASNPGVYEKDENLVYNYLWLLVKALSVKKRMFQNFSDYDDYAFHSANRLYFALMKNWQNQGKPVKGKIIKPIKSCLNYTKALLYPMKVEFQNNHFRQVLSQEMTNKKFDSFAYREQLFDQARSESYKQQLFYLGQSLNNLDSLLDSVLEKSHFNKHSVERIYLKNSVLLTTNYVLRTKGKLVDLDQNSTVIPWRMPKSVSSYIRDLTNEFFRSIKQLIVDCFEMDRPDDTILSKMISNPEGNYEEEWD